MKIKFLQDYQGRETAGAAHKAGGVVEMDHQPAIELIRFGIAEEVTDVIEKQKRKPREVLDDENA